MKLQWLPRALPDGETSDRTYDGYDRFGTVRASVENYTTYGKKWSNGYGEPPCLTRQEAMLQAEEHVYEDDSGK